MGTVYGYCRISTKKQSIERQIRNILREYPDAILKEEAYTGTKMNRPKWNKLYQSVKSGDTIVFDSVSRMSRNAEEGLQVYLDLFNRGVNLVFLKEPQINTDTYKKAMKPVLKMTGTDADYILEGINKYLSALAKEQIALAFQQSQKEVDDIRQRTKEGLKTRKLNGQELGHKKGTQLTTKKSIKSKKLIRYYSKAFDGTLKDNDVMKLIDISRPTYYKYKRELLEEDQNKSRV